MFLSKSKRIKIAIVGFLKSFTAKSAKQRVRARVALLATIKSLTRGRWPKDIKAKKKLAKMR